MDKEIYYDIYKYDYTEICFNVEDVIVTLYSAHNNTVPEVLALEKIYEKQRASDFHKHPYIEVHTSAHETYNIYFPEKKLEVKEHSFIAVSPKTSHYIDSKIFSGTICINFLFEKNNLKTEYSLYALIKKVFDAPYVYIPNSKNLVEISRKILTSIENGNIFMISCYFHQLICAILKEKNMLPLITPDEMIPDSNVSRYRKIENFISENYNTNISVKDLANKLNLSERQTSRIVREMYSLSFNDVIAEKRVKKACKYLQDKKMSVGTVSSLVGYTSIRCFYNAFRKHTGCLPGEYRKATE